MQNQNQMKKMTQKKAVFYILWKSFRENPEAFVPAWKFVGELEIPEIGEDFFMSYKCPANGVNIHFENPGLLERREVNGRSGSKYFEYKIWRGSSRETIIDTDLREFYDRLKEGTRRMTLKPIIPEAERE